MNVHSIILVISNYKAILQAKLNGPILRCSSMARTVKWYRKPEMNYKKMNVSNNRTSNLYFTNENSITCVNVHSIGKGNAFTSPTGFHGSPVRADVS